MKQERIEIREGDSHIFEIGRIIVTVKEISQKAAGLVVGRPGLPNAQASLETGGVTLFETPDGLYEVRLLQVRGVTYANILLTEIVPRPGLAAGYVEQDASNAPFTHSELKRISQSLDLVREEIEKREEFNAEQIAYIRHKLSEMREGAQRFGRKDWINWVVGTLTSIVLNASIDTSAGKILFNTVSSALSWVVDGSIKLLELSR